MSGMVDIHCHILPGIDDGPEDLAASLEMARAASGSGISTIVATPHLRQDFPKVKIDEIADRVDVLQQAIDQEGIDLTVVPGGEVGLGWALDADDAQLKLASYGQRGTDLLIETPDVGGPMLPSLLTQVASRGYRVTLAHPERLSDFQEDPERLESLRDRGVLLQVNADAILGEDRKAPHVRLARTLLGRGAVAVVASDAHRGRTWRPIGRLAEVRDEIESAIGAEVARTLVVAAPDAVLRGVRTPQVSAGNTRRQRGLRRWRFP